MRIGELAALIGVSTRTVRHYHHLGLLPEPERLANGYREYRLRDAVLLARIRQLATLGMSLDELRDVLADDEGWDIREVLQELDADLAKQQDAIARRRERLAVLLKEADLGSDALVSPDLAAVLSVLPASGSAFAEMDREMLALVAVMGEEGDQAEVAELLRPLTEPEALERGHELYRRLDALATADPDDPEVEAVADALAAHLPAEMRAAMVHGGEWYAAITSEMSPAQAEVFRLLLQRAREGT
ncbi:MerR family transcriptional regulator [Nonomuraea sp. NBC_01738]|uniref:MerR family transcriptional regulator n=1 Tax=Nonomuraea sp. NBC_01738 TaxID=2976003 RepID=UPI002E13F130|nr:MerR family transcriptional regulator [Nonomuraea sp. NBC_01738]